MDIGYVGMGMKLFERAQDRAGRQRVLRTILVGGKEGTIKNTS